MFIDSITQILTNEGKVEGLPNGKLAAVNAEGEEVSGTLSNHDRIMIARLQTLIAQEHERSEMPDFHEVKDTMQRQNKVFAEVAVNSLIIREDSMRRIQMIEQLIIEIVRKVIPAECERFGCTYFINHNMKLCRGSTRRFSRED